MGVKKSIFISCLLFAWMRIIFSQPTIIEPLLSKQELSEDLDSLHAILIHTHSDPYAYMSPETLEAQFDAVRDSIQGEMTATAFYKLINPIFIRLHDIHSRLYLSGRNNSYALNGGYYLPMRVRLLAGKMLLDATKDSLFPRGSEVLSVNDIPAHQISRELLAQSYTDGEIGNTRERVMEEDFFSLFPLFFPVERNNKIRYVVPGATDTLEGELSGIRLIGSKQEVKARKKRQRKSGKKKEIPLSFEIRQPESAMILKINSFSTGSRGQYDRLLKQAFTTLSDQDIEHLIIDLRSNRGGFIDRGTQLMGYLTDAPFPYISHSVVRASPLLKHKIKRGMLFPGLSIALFKGAIGKEIVAGWQNPSGSTDTVYWDPIDPQKPKRQFGGEVYLLVDGLSISNSSLVHSAIRNNQLGVSIGTTCGGTANGTFGNSADFQLPNSRISGKISTIRILSVPDDESYQEQALAPDYLVPVTVADFVADRDVQLEFALELIRKKMATQ